MSQSISPSNSTIGGTTTTTTTGGSVGFGLINVYKSTITNGPVTNLGGPPSIVLQENETINGFFNWDSIHANSIYSIFYVKNDNYSGTSSNLTTALEIRLDYTKNLDIVAEEYLRSLQIDILRPNYATIGYVHPAITLDGFFVESYPKKITDFVQDDELGRRILFIEDSLAPGDFFPFIVRLTLTEPVGPIFRQPLKINTYSGVF